MSKTVDLDLPKDYWKRDPLRVTGVSRDGENDQVLLIGFNRRPDDDELRAVHEKLRDTPH